MQVSRITNCVYIVAPTHVETVVLLSKLKTDKHINVELEMDELDLMAAESKATYEEVKDYVSKAKRIES